MKANAKTILSVLGLTLLVTSLGWTQSPDRQHGMIDQVAITIGRDRPISDTSRPLPHPFHIDARHWPEGCDAARTLYESFGTLPAAHSIDAEMGCGAKFYDYEGENLVTSAGETAYSQMMAATAAPPATCNYIALTNTAITAAVGDTTLSGEIVANGLSRAQGTFTDTSAALGAPPTPATPTTVGTTGAGNPFYWIFACTYQGCTAVGSSSNLATSNTTLTTANYNVITFTGKLGAAYYRVIRTHNSTTPSGALAGGSTFATSDGEISNQAFCTDLVAGTAPSCTAYDQSNTLTAYTVPASDQTFVGKYTITKTFTATGTQAAQAFGILNAASVGTMCLEGTFTQASLVTNDTLAFTETVFH